MLASVIPLSSETADKSGPRAAMHGSARSCAIASRQSNSEAATGRYRIGLHASARARHRSGAETAARESGASRRPGQPHRPRRLNPAVTDRRLLGPRRWRGCPARRGSACGRPARERLDECSCCPTRTGGMPAPWPEGRSCCRAGAQWSGRVRYPGHCVHHAERGRPRAIGGGPALWMNQMS